MKAWIFLFVSLTAGRACTVCDSGIGAEVRAGIFDSAFWPTLLEVAAPFPVLGLIFLVLYRVLPT